MNEYVYCPVCGAKLIKKNINNKKRKFCPECGFIYYKNPAPTVCGIVKNKNRLLLIKRGIPPHVGEWAFPCGFIEYGETAEEACLRELHEETGVEGKIKSLLSVKSIDTNEYGSILIINYAVVTVDEYLIAGDDAIGAKYFNVDEAKKVIIPEQLECLEYEEALLG